MKTLLSLCALVLLPILPAHASEFNILRCRKGANPEAVTVAYTDAGGENRFRIRISDDQIARQLGVRAPYDTAAKSLYYLNGPLDGVGYQGLAGEYASGVDLIPDHGGVKILAVQSTSEGIRTYPESNWYFNPGECVAN
jgi:hypothetical protein